MGDFAKAYGASKAYADNTLTQYANKWKNVVGDFATIDPSKYAFSGATGSFVDGVATCNPTASYGQFLVKQSNVEYGKKYLVTCKVKADSATSLQLYAFAYNVSTNLGGSGGNTYSVGTDWVRMTTTFTLNYTNVNRLEVGPLNKKNSPYVQFYVKEFMIIDVTTYALDAATIESLAGYWSLLPTSSNNSITSGTANIALFLQSKWKDKIWTTLGDSIMYANNIQPVVNSSLGFATINNLAVAGQSVETMADNLTTEIANASDLITLYGCFNNFTPGGLPIGSITDSPNKSGTTFLSKFKYTVETVLNLAPTKLFVIIGTHNGTDAYRPALYGAVNGSDDIGNYVKAMGELARHYGLPFIDMYNLSGFNAFSLSTYTNDNLHPNSTGAAKIGNILANELRLLEPLS